MPTTDCLERNKVTSLLLIVPPFISYEFKMYIKFYTYVVNFTYTGHYKIFL